MDSQAVSPPRVAILSTTTHKPAISTQALRSEFERDAFVAACAVTVA